MRSSASFGQSTFLASIRACGIGTRQPALGWNPSATEAWQSWASLPRECLNARCRWGWTARGTALPRSSAEKSKVSASRGGPGRRSRWRNSRTSQKPKVRWIAWFASLGCQTRALQRPAWLALRIVRLRRRGIGPAGAPKSGQRER